MIDEQKQELKQKYEEILNNLDNDIAEAEHYKQDLNSLYDVRDDIDNIIKIQSMNIKITDYISQKRIQRVEIERQYNEIQ